MNHLVCVVALAWKDLWHDWRMTLCLVLTVASIALPLLLFFGLKNGAIQTLRQRMLHDPVFMELVPQGTATYDAAWFERWRADPRVGFLVPRTRELSVSGEFVPLPAARADTPDGTPGSRPAKTAAITADMLPTAPGDWLLLSYAMPIPDATGCVLTAPLAARLEVREGDSVRIRIGRQRRGGGLESAERDFVVRGVLPEQAGGLAQAFLPLEQLERMEDYRDGRAVPEWGWNGEAATVRPVFHVVLLYTAAAPDPVLMARIRQNTGFARVEPVPPPPETPPGMAVFRLQSGLTPVDSTKLNELRNLLRGETAFVVPLAQKDATQEGIRVRFPELGQQEQDGGLALHATALWRPLPGQPSPEQAMPKETVPEETSPNTEQWSGGLHPFTLLLASPALAHRAGNKPVLAEFAAPSGHSLRLAVRLAAVEGLADTAVYAAPGLVGTLNHLHLRRLVADVPASLADGTCPLPAEAAVQPGRRDYPRFRMYAAGLDQVAPLAAALEAEGIRMGTRAADIERVRLMDKYLNLLFALIAGGALAGGTVCLLSSLYSNVERKRRELAVLRLLGVHGVTLCAFPLAAGLSATALGLGLGLLCFHLLGLGINGVAAQFTLSGETLCVLTLRQQGLALLLALAAAVAAGATAALRLLGLQPAACLRDE